MVQWFGATYAAATVSDPPGGIYAALSLLTHIPMLYAVVYAFNARHFRLATVGLSSLIISLLYHACRSSVVCLGGTNVNQWRQLDHIFVLWVIGELGLHLLVGSLSGPSGRGFFVIMGFLVFPVGTTSELLFPYSLLSGVLMIAFLVVAGAARLGLYLCGDNDDDTPPQGLTSDLLTLVCLLVTLCCLLLGFLLYNFDDGDPAGASPTDQLSHDGWHLASGFALWAGSASVSYRTEAALRWKYGRH